MKLHFWASRFSLTGSSGVTGWSLVGRVVVAATLLQAVFGYGSRMAVAGADENRTASLKNGGGERGSTGSWLPTAISVLGAAKPDSPLKLARPLRAASEAVMTSEAVMIGQDPVKPVVPDPAPAPARDQKPVAAPASKDRQLDLDAESIRIDSSLVVVPVSVTDQQGQPIRDLTAADFILEEEGVRQQVQTLGDPGKTPIELALLFDVSRSVRNRFDFEKTAAARFLEVVLKTGDYASVFSIGRSPRLSVERTDAAGKAIAGTLGIEPTEEATAFFDTVVTAARYIEEKAPAGARRVLVVISDGEDNNSELYLLRDALREAQSSNCLFYAINPSGPSIRLNRMSIRGHEGMVRLANETGGMAFLPDRLEDLDRVFNHIATELQAQYLLGYYPTNEQNDGKFRRIAVRVDRQADLRIRARQGYYAPRE